jgi:hypothetical protein
VHLRIHYLYHLSFLSHFVTVTNEAVRQQDPHLHVIFGQEESGPRATDEAMRRRPDGRGLFQEIPQ